MTASIFPFERLEIYADYCEGIILVGGLGSSPYLFEYLKSAQSKAGIIVLQSGGMKPYV